jgi:hypothetical protein
MFAIISQNLPANVTYDPNRQVQYSDCTKFEFIHSKNSSGIIEIEATCTLENSSIYKANVKAPISIPKSMINKKICFDSNNTDLSTLYANTYCIGPVFALTNVTATQDDNDNITIQINPNNIDGYGRGKNVKVVYNYQDGLTIDTNSIGNGKIDKENKTITWIIPLINPGEEKAIIFKALNTGNLSSLNIKGNIEGEAFEKSVIIKKNTPSFVKGDWTQNGELDLPDLVRCRKYLAGFEGIESPGLEIVDMDSNGELDITDLAKLRKYFATEY